MKTFYKNIFINLMRGLEVIPYSFLLDDFYQVERIINREYKESNEKASIKEKNQIYIKNVI